MKKILIVDDQSFIREVFKQQLAALEDVTIIEASNGSEALGKAKVSRPDLILLDIVMPSKDGFDVLKELIQDPNTYDVPVVIVSSHADNEHITQAKELGVKEFIDKANLNNIDFLGLVKKYIG